MTEFRGNLDIHGTRLLPDTMERAFINKETGKTDEYVFVFDRQGEYRYPCTNNIPFASLMVDKEEYRPSFTAAAQGVGRLMSLVTQGYRQSEMEEHYWSVGTAFYVAPNMLTCALHTFEPEEYHAYACFFTPVFNFSHADLENLLVRFKFPLNGQQPTPECLAELQKREVWLVHREKQALPIISPYQLFVLDYDNSTKMWFPKRDYAFLSIARESAMWFLPSTTVPTQAQIALIAYSTPFSVYDMENLCPHLPKEEGSYHFCPILKVPDIMIDVNRKFISPGHIVTAGSNDIGLAHRASAMMSSSGGPIIPVSDAPFDSPVPFYGIHVGTFDFLAPWNYALSAKHKSFVVEWFLVVFPQIEKKIPTLNVDKKKQLKDYLHKVVEAYEGSAQTVEKKILEFAL